MIKMKAIFLLVFQMKGEVPPPHLIVVSPGTYDGTSEEFLPVVEKSRDKLLPRGYSYCRAQEYHLGKKKTC